MAGEHHASHLSGDGIDVCEKPIFVVGSPRSGTTALATGLARHPELWTSDESFFLHSLFGSGRVFDIHRRHHERKSPSWLQTQGVDRGEFLAYLGLGVNALFSSRSGGRRWIDQTPLYTQMVFELSELFPTAQFLHIVRDGRLVVHSMSNFLNKFRDRPEAVQYVPDWAYDFREACTTWTSWVEKAEEFRLASADRCLLVRNEHLLESPEQQCAAIFGFLGVADEPGPLDYFRTTRTNSSFDRKAPADPVDDGWLGWDEERRAIFTSVAGETMARLGYLAPEDVEAHREGVPAVEDA